MDWFINSSMGMNRRDMILSIIILSLLLGVTIPILLWSLTKANTSTCDWHCHYGPSYCYDESGHPTSKLIQEDSCKCLSQAPFCPEQNLDACEDYFLGELPYSCPTKDIRSCPVCSLYFSSSNPWVNLSLPYYGMFVKSLTLTNIEYVGFANQSLTLFLNGNPVHVFSSQDNHTSLTLVIPNEFNPDLILSFKFGQIDTFGSDMLFIQSIQLDLDLSGYLFMVCLLINIFMIMMALIFLMADHLHQRRLRNDHAPLLIN